MQIVELDQFRNDIEGVLAKAQTDEVLICNHGAALALLSKPRVPADRARYLEERERLLSGITVDPDWDSTQAISEDRDRA